MGHRFLPRVLLVVMLFVFIDIQADSSVNKNIEYSGDIIQVLLPITAYATTFYLDDEEGRNEFYKSFFLTVGITHGLKFTIKKERPNNKGNDSFPSGHTSASFQGATFIHKKYGLAYGIPAYIAASYVGWSRVKSEKHYIEDVLAGATIGILSTYYFTSPYKNLHVNPIVNSGNFGFNLSYKW